MKYPSPAICALIALSLLLLVYSIVREVNKSINGHIDAGVRAELVRRLTHSPTLASPAPTTAAPVTTHSPTPCKATNETVDPFEGLNLAEWWCNCSEMRCEGAVFCDLPFRTKQSTGASRYVLPAGCWCSGVMSCTLRWP